MGRVGIPIERPIMQLDTGATAWMLISSSLVLLMTVPGLALFYGGMSRTKSVLNMFMMSFGAFALVGVVYPLWGWSMTYGGRDIAGVFANPFSQFGLGGGFEGTRIDDFGVPAWVSVAFQMTFAIIAVALISGSLAERVKFSTWMAFTAIWVTLVYFPMAHMVWGGGLLSGDGPIARLIGVAPIDFAGGTVVHINAGVAGLVLALIIGKRPGFGLEVMRPHNLPFVMVGAALLLFGWFGFNAGSAFTANALAGLVAITPGAGALDPLGSILIGFIVGVACAHAVSLKLRFGFDDSLDVVGVHLVGGLIGTILIGLLALDGALLHGGGFGLLIVQTLVALIALAFSGAVTALIALVLGATLGWRVAPQIEAAGIDLGEHSESAYESAPALRLS